MLRAARTDLEPGGVRLNGGLDEAADRPVVIDGVIHKPVGSFYPAGDSSAIQHFRTACAHFAELTEVFDSTVGQPIPSAPSSSCPSARKKGTLDEVSTPSHEANACDRYPRELPLAPSSADGAGAGIDVIDAV